MKTDLSISLFILVIGGRVIIKVNFISMSLDPVLRFFILWWITAYILEDGVSVGPR